MWDEPPADAPPQEWAHGPCKACAKADRGLTALFYADCPRCEVRAIAMSPKHIREQAYKARPEGTERDEFKRAVSEEWRRMKMLSMEG